ncbi:hypothetical protein [Microscilla marina]|uniref:Uncharacterized protein n=1 Tax=Microscilla marina ATCC 23134 TaxID=313606 RepID=A1ZG87_MICM2|nr:hypothetical protein [Microscilla marina]EAY30504.1 hypothetical protein M23134_03140 [Microscilla marina ATCC 23134]
MKPFILTEFIFILLSITGFVLKIALVFWGTPVLIIGLLGLSLIYFRQGLRPALLNDQPTAASDRFFIPLYKLGYLLFAINTLGVLFKSMLWDTRFLGFSMFILMAYTIFIAAQVLKGKFFFKKLLIKSIFIATLALTFYQTPLSKLIQLYYRDQPEFAQKFIEYRENPQNEVKKKNYLEARKKMLNKNAKK